MYFLSKKGHDNKEMSFLLQRGKTTKYGKPDSQSMLLKKDLDQKKEVWNWIEETSFKRESGDQKGSSHVESLVPHRPQQEEM